MVLDFVTTAMARPDVVDATYKSFTQNLKGVDWAGSTLYINIDPLPEGVSRKGVVAMGRKYFGNVIARCPGQANFADAYKWLWQQPKGEFFFNLEDDWVLTEEIDVNELVAKFNDILIQSVSLRAYPYLYKTIPMSPSIYRTSFFELFAKKLRTDQNPETQLHDHINLINKTHNIKRTHMRAVYPFDGDTRRVVKDIGREWIEQSGYTRPQLLEEGDPRKLKKNSFVRWVKK